MWHPQHVTSAAVSLVFRVPSAHTVAHACVPVISTATYMTVVASENTGCTSPPAGCVTGWTHRRNGRFSWLMDTSQMDTLMLHMPAAPMTGGDLRSTVCVHATQQ